MRAVGEAMRLPAVIAMQVEKTTRTAERTRQKRERRLQLYEEVATLIRNAPSQSEASRRLGVSLRTVQRWMTCGVFPERKRRIFPSSVDAFSPYLSKRVSEGCTNVSQLWRKIRQQGFDGQLSTVWNWIRQHFAHSQNTQGSTMSKRTHPVSPHQIAWLMLKVDPARSKYLTALCQFSPELASIARVARSLFNLLRTRNAHAWSDWSESAEHSPLAAFARHLCRDKDAVPAALRLPWSNGMVEGHVHRLKLLKRQMYGRAGFDLLRERVLNGA